MHPFPSVLLDSPSGDQKAALCFLFRDRERTPLFRELKDSWHQLRPRLSIIPIFLQRHARPCPLGTLWLGGGMIPTRNREQASVVSMKGWVHWSGHRLGGIQWGEIRWVLKWLIQRAELDLESKVILKIALWLFPLGLEMIV